MKNWTEQEDQFLRTHLADGWSAGQIAVMLPGRTRNSVIGRAQRQGIVMLAKRGDFCKPAVPKAVKRIARVVARTQNAPKIKPTEYDSTSLNIPLLDLEVGQCKWPTGYVDEHLFCGRHTEGVYCPTHHRRGVE